MGDINDSTDKKSPFQRLLEHTGIVKDYSKPLPHADDNLGDKPWEKVKPSTPAKEPDKPQPEPNTSVSSTDSASAIADKIAARNKTISDKVGGWSKNNPKKDQDQ